MVWGAISVHGVSRLHIVEGTMRQDQYQQVLATRLLPQIHEWFGDAADAVIFQQDSAPCHVAKKVKEFIRQQGLSLLDWPGNSADMNPIENIWKMLKDKMNQENVITNKRQLMERMLQVWFHDQQLKDCAKSMIRQMPVRIAAVIKARGGWTKY